MLLVYFDQYFDQCLTQNQNDSQLFIGKNAFLKKRAHFLGIKSSGANLKKHVYLVVKILLQISCFFHFLAQKMLTMTISTSVWSLQHPNAGRNIQHMLLTPQPPRLIDPLVVTQYRHNNRAIQQSILK